MGREGDLCSCVFRFGKVEKDVNIGFGLLFGAAVPAFEEDMETEVDCVRIKFRIPPLVRALPLTSPPSHPLIRCRPRLLVLRARVAIRSR